jgi:hypothetical protein
MDNFEIQRVLNKLHIPHSIISYDNVESIDPSIPNWIILFTYPNASLGHWTALLFYPEKKKVLFFDPYGFMPDEQWNFIENPLNEDKPPMIFSKKVLPGLRKLGWRIENNHYNIQGHFTGSLPNSNVAENMCGELVALRIIRRDMSSKQFYKYIIENYTPRKIYDLIKYIHDGKL